MSLRIGYINVHGLNEANWAAALAALNTTFDFLFLAETWYVNHARYRNHVSVVAHTERPLESFLRQNGRPTGGIYLLGTKKARASVVKQVVISDYAITFQTHSAQVSGLYLPPSLPTDVFIAVFESVSTSTVVLGDINTRFYDPVYQSGRPGPPAWVLAASSWTGRHHFTHLKPGLAGNATSLPHLQQSPELNLNHCFIRQGRYAQHQLCLPLLPQLGFRSDHKYALHLVLSYTASRKAGADRELPRYRLSRLADPLISTLLVERFLTEEKLQPTIGKTKGIDRLNRQIVHLCQLVCAEVLGRIGPTTQQRKPSVVLSRADEPTQDAAVRLYKQAVASAAENSPIQPSPDALMRGESALNENTRILTARYRALGLRDASTLQAQPPTSLFHVDPFTMEEISAEILRQDGTKGCGADGIHIRICQILVETPLIRLLYLLYLHCITTGRTPDAWNETEIQLLSKDNSGPRDATNLRPITLICMFRKVFERLLLTRFDRDSTDGWSKLHRAQAGFRKKYSTSMNAGIVHQLLSSGARDSAIFLDFRSAFDVVDHGKLTDVLRERGCPPYILALITSLMFRRVRSRLLINGEVSDWFSRTCGVLQGSPLSPYLFNIFIDSLLHCLNPSIPRGPLVLVSDLPTCLFFADDGTILPVKGEDVQALLDIVHEWSTANAIALNVGKCGYVRTAPLPSPPRLGSEEVPYVQSYKYLGFPMTVRGIDFKMHLHTRMTATVRWASFLRMEAEGWGVAHRLRIYQTFLAPMFEYGAPLVWAWVKGGVGKQNETEFIKTSRPLFKELLGWIAGSISKRTLVISNLCGLVSLQDRFAYLRSSFQRNLEELAVGSPMRDVLSLGFNKRSYPFAASLVTDPAWHKWKRLGDVEPTPREAFKRYLEQAHVDLLKSNAKNASLTALIPWESRGVPGLSYADISLSAPVIAQGALFHYRLGVFMHGVICACERGKDFQRGHEECRLLPYLTRLTVHERAQKQKAAAKLQTKDSTTRFTDLDFLINTGQLRRASKILSILRKTLDKIRSIKTFKASVTEAAVALAAVALVAL